MNYTKGQWETGQATVKGLSDDTKHIAVAVGSKIIALTGIVAAFDERESKSNAYLIAAAQLFNICTIWDSQVKVKK